MSSFLSLKKAAVLAAMALVRVQGAALADSCPRDIPLSCSNSTPVADSCCFEFPGGVLLQTQFWDYSPSVGPEDSFTLHGLWPDNCDGSYSQFCDSSLQISSATDVLTSFGETDLLNTMKTYWKDYQGDDNNLWVHEFNKHGTCLSTIKPSCYQDFKSNQEVVDYYKKAVQLFENLPSYKWLEDAGIVPSDTATYTKDAIAEALQSKFGRQVYFKCDSNKALNEIWYFYHLHGSVVHGDYVPMDSIPTSSCPDSGIKFVPKNSASTTTATTGTATPTSTAAPGSSGYLKPDGQSGCLISNGKWYVSGTCATYKLSTASFGGYELTSSKGSCGLDSDGNFACGSSITAGQFDYDSSSGYVTYGGETGWSAPKNPSGTAQVAVQPGSGESVQFKLTFQAK
ncbi:hypothetical protein OGAPHI_003743 [Ogataea philodendri]|uniref:Ribonuclease T2-like n=1 Tax=Ogataea philodendri TaxID=1378263 RepID=A0A9P8T552_9ASCO|nr:uncharacterized protein OGAPHI_003743 [Ogataea philodendri]KAH3665556.1 hypothetical protein OGAPHI_003743 [Ogataea philodendri]